MINADTPICKLDVSDEERSQTMAMRPEDPATRARTVQSLFEAIVTTRQRRAAQARQARAAQPAQPPDTGRDETEIGEGIYIISVAARMLHMHPQTLRKYERVGLVRPSRTGGMLRLYSERDIAKLRMIKHLVDELRLNLAGVEMAIAVFDRLSAARSDMDKAQSPPPRAFDRAMHEILELFQGRQAW